MFRNGTALPESPKNSKYKDTDMLSCRAMDGVPGFGGNAVPVEDYEYFNELAWKRRNQRRNEAPPSKSSAQVLVMSSVFFAVVAWLDLE